MCARARVVRGGEIGCVRAWPRVRSRVRATVVVGGWAGGHPAWAGKQRRIHLLTMKGVSWQRPGCGLRSVGQPQAEKRSRDSNLSRRRWQSPAAAERWRAVPQGRGSEGGGLPV